MSEGPRAFDRVCPAAAQRAVVSAAETDSQHLAENLRGEGVPARVWATCLRDLGSDWRRNPHRLGAGRPDQAACNFTWEEVMERFLGAVCV